ncbi:TlpA disulfide reductase family protein [Williamsia deligens]|uniref:TlpA disulfide reductase family protein n=1 Tax=Williamsia deligens TaxID=321325 RepID=A0ABW3G3R3_9NOCA|nr:TlpA disulfide reductase family protein [Williamsia deligens]
MCRAFGIVLTAVALVAALAACGTGKDAVAQGDTFEFVSPGGKTEITYDPPSSRKRVRDLSGENVVTGARLGLSDFDGKVVVINVWGQWCAPCRAEVGDLEQVYTDTAPLGVEFLGINFRDNRQEAQDYIRNNDVTYPSIFDYPGRTLVRLTTPTSVVPTTVVLDRYHRAAAVFLRTISAAELDPLVRRLAAEPYTPPASPSGTGTSVVRGEPS